jgi:phosphoserine phosphatase
MATVVFDFDSTLVPVESLEEVLRASAPSPEVLRWIADITRRGMEGELDFRASLEARLALAAPTLEAVRATGHSLADRLTPGTRECVAALLADGHQVRIVSGGFRDVILPAARVLGLDASHVHAVAVHWTPDGTFAGLVEDGFIDSKAAGVRDVHGAWPRPVIAVGDGATDLALATAGVADHFVAFTAHVRRRFIDEAEVPEAAGMDELRVRLADLLSSSSD